MVVVVAVDGEHGKVTCAWWLARFGERLRAGEVAERGACLFHGTAHDATSRAGYAQRHERVSPARIG